jgi:hypothetical protein
MLASKKKWADLVAVVAVCSTRIFYLEKEIEELKKELRNISIEKRESKRFVSNRRLTVYLALLSFFSPLVVKLLDFLL